MTAWTETTKLNGRTTTRSYDLATRVETVVTPAGRTTSSLFDAQGRILQLDPPDDLSIFFQYDANGRLLTTTQGTRVTGRTYGSDGMLASVTDPLAQTTAFSRNARGDVLTEVRPDSDTSLVQVSARDYDAVVGGWAVVEFSNGREPSVDDDAVEKARRSATERQQLCGEGTRDPRSRDRARGRRATRRSHRRWRSRPEPRAGPGRERSRTACLVTVIVDGFTREDAGPVTLLASFEP